MDLQKMIVHKLHYYKQLHKQIDAHQTKASSIMIRKNGLKNKK